MNLEQQKELINLYNRYQDTDASIIKTNLKAFMDKLNLKPGHIAKKTDIPVQTIYQLRKITSIYKPDLIISIIICDFLKVSITAVLQPIPELETPEPYEPIQTKWTEEAKKEFINDYNRLDITEVCNKYNLTPRTAQEYNKNFIRDIENV